MVDLSHVQKIIDQPTVVRAHIVDAIKNSYILFGLPLPIRVSLLLRFVFSYVGQLGTYGGRVQP